MLDVSFYFSFILQPNSEGKGLKCERPSYKYMRDDKIYVSFVLKMCLHLDVNQLDWIKSGHFRIEW